MRQCVGIQQLLVGMRMCVFALFISYYTCVE